LDKIQRKMQNLDSKFKNDRPFYLKFNGSFQNAKLIQASLGRPPKTKAETSTPVSTTTLAFFPNFIEPFPYLFYRRLNIFYT